MKKSSRKLLALCLSASLCAPLFFGCGTNEKKTISTEAVAETESSESVQKETGQAVEQTDVSWNRWMGFRMILSAVWMLQRYFLWKQRGKILWI